MSVICHACGRRNRQSAQFCDGCGVGLAHHHLRASHNDEQRHGTFLSCDVKDYTQLANQLDLEDLSSIIQAFRAVVRQVVLEHGGHLYPFTGDGAFISFGYPKMREDADESAVRAGLALVEGVRSIDVLPSIRLELRVGIASGVVGSRPSTNESPVGNTVNLSARLQSEAPPSGVVISDATRRQVGQYFEYREVGPFRLKGFVDPVSAWLVVGQTDVASRFDAHHDGRASGDLLGRQVLLNELLEEWKRAKAGTTRFVVLSGDAGIGKSRLARALRDYARLDGANWLAMDCTPSAQRTPLHPISALLRRMLNAGSAPATTPEQRLRTLLERQLGSPAAVVAAAYLAPLVGLELVGAPPEESPERVRAQVIATLLTLLSRIAQQGPTILLVEDIHWADPTTLLLLQTICERQDFGSLLLVATTRPVVDGGGEIQGATVINVEPLSRADAHTLIRTTRGSAALNEDVIGGILDRAEGNPLLLEELTRELIERGAITPSADASGDATADVPTSLKVVIAARLDRHARLKPLVQAASVLGREFPFRLLARVMSDTVAHLRAPVSDLAALGLLAPTSADSPDQTLRFRHALIQEAVYRTIFRSDRQRLHARAADVLMAEFEESPESASDVLAHHLAAATRYEEAVRCLLSAGGSTARRAAYLESAAFCRTGLDTAEQVRNVTARNELKLELLTQLGVALSATTGYATPEVESAYSRARALCDEGAAPEVLFPVVRGLGTFYFVRGQLGPANEISDACLRLARQANRVDFLIEALSFRGYASLYRGAIEDARQALDECLRLYQTHGGHEFRYPSPQDAGTAAWSLLPIVLWLAGDTTGSDAAVPEAIAHAERLGRAFDVAYVHVWIAMLRNMQRRFDDAAEHAGLCIAVAERHGFNTWLLAATMHASIAASCRTPAASDLAMLRQMLTLFINAGAEASASFFLWGLAQGLRVAGDNSGAATAVAEGVQRADASGETFFKTELLTLQAELESDDARADSMLAQAIELGASQRVPVLAVRAAIEVLRRKHPGSGSATRPPNALASLQPLSHDATWWPTVLSDARQALGLSPLG